MSDNNFHPCPLDGAIALQISLTHFHVARLTMESAHAVTKWYGQNIRRQNSRM